MLADALEQQAHLVAADDEERAIELHHEALAIRAERGLRAFWVDSLAAVAALGGAGRAGGRAPAGAA